MVLARRLVLRLAILAVVGLASSCAGKVEPLDTRDDAGSSPTPSASATATAPTLVALATTTPSVEWGYVDCGATRTKAAHLKNTGGRALRCQLSVTGDAFVLDGAPALSLAPGAEVDVSLRVRVPRDVAPRVPIEGELVVDLGEGAPLRVRLRVIPDGAIVMLTPASASFGPVPVGDIGAPIHVDVANEGNAPVTITFAVPDADGFGLSWTNVPAAFTLTPKQKETIHATFAPRAAGPKRFDAKITIDGAACGNVPDRLTLTGDAVGIADAGPG